MEILTLPVGELAANCYICFDKARDDALLIDPGADAQSIRGALAGRTVAGVLLTHGHFDHTGALSAFADGKIYIGREDAAMLGDARLSVGAQFGDTRPRPAATDLLSEGDAFALAGLSVTVLHTPGHTPGGVCYDISGALFTGDTLFVDGYGRTDFPGGDSRALMTSLRRLLSLRGRAYYPGHGEAGRVR